MPASACSPIPGLAPRRVLAPDASRQGAIRVQPWMFCGDACRQEQFRRCRPLGWRLIAYVGIEGRSVLEMLRDAGLGDA